jgi:hypothetical protein
MVFLTSEVDIAENFVIKLAEAGPYALLTGITFLLFYGMFKASIKELREFASKAIEEIRKGYEDAFARIKK